MLRITFGTVGWKFSPKLCKFEQVSFTIESIDITQKLVINSRLGSLLNQNGLSFVIVRVEGRLLYLADGRSFFCGAFLHNFTGFVMDWNLSMLAWVSIIEDSTLIKHYLVLLRMDT